MQHLINMYQYSNFSGNIKNTQTKEIFIRDDRNQNFIDFLQWQCNEENEIVFVEMFSEEIAEANKPKVPQTISAMRLKLQLFDMGITDQDIFDDIDSIPDFMFSFAEKEKSKIMYKTSTIFERTNDRLNFVAAMEGLTQEQVDEIFINGNLLR